MVYPHNTYYSAMKINEIPIHATAWMNFENFMLSDEARHTHTNNILYDCIYNEVHNGKLYTDRKQNSDC